MGRNNQLPTPLISIFSKNYFLVKQNNEKIGRLDDLIFCFFLNSDGWNHTHFGNSSDFGLKTSEFGLKTSLNGLITAEFRGNSSDSGLNSSDFGFTSPDFGLKSSDLKNSRFGRRRPPSFSGHCNRVCGCSHKCHGKIP